MVRGASNLWALSAPTGDRTIFFVNKMGTPGVALVRIGCLPYPATTPNPLPRNAWLKLTSADKFLVEIAATLMARYRLDEVRSGDVSQPVS
jgi:hypothetical protein